MDLTHVRMLVPTDKIKPCFLFYRDTLGFESDYDADSDSIYMELDAGSVVLALFAKDVMAQVADTADKPAHADVQDPVTLCIAVDDVDAAFASAKEKGAEVVQEPQDQPDWNLRHALLRDPAGNLVELNKTLE